MRRDNLLGFAIPAFLAMTSGPSVHAEPPTSRQATAAETMQSVFANRLRDGGFWRQDNPDFQGGTDARYWMQVWRSGPGGEVVVVDAYAVRADDTCTALVHIVYVCSTDGSIESHAYGANGMRGHGTVEFDGTVTSSQATLQFAGGREVKMRDRADQGAAEEIVVKPETWDGNTWIAGKPASWHRSAQGPPCANMAANPTR